MSIIDAFRLFQRNSTATTDAIVSPWSESDLKTFVWSDVFGNVDSLPLTRAEAMRVPAVAKARNLLAPLVGRNPLVAFDANGVRLPRDKQPTWAYRTDQDTVSPQHMWTWVADDLIFYGLSVLHTVRGSDGFPITFDRISPNNWQIKDGVLLITGADGKQFVAQESEYTVIPGIVDPLLDIGARSIRGARYIEDAWVGRARNPIPQTVLQQTDADATLTKPEVEKIVKDWGTKRRDPDGSITFLPYGLDMKPLGAEADSKVFIEARNALRTDIGGFVGIPSSVMDASLSTASLTYSTAEGNRNSFYDQALPLYADPIAFTLSLDGTNPIVPRGQYVRFDFSDLFAQLPNATGPEGQD